MLRRVHRQNSNINIAHIAWLQNTLALYGTRTPALVSVLGSDFKLLGLPGMVPLLRAVLRQRRCILAPNGEWMVPALRRHFGDVADIRYVPLGIDSRWFGIQRHPVSKPRRWLVVLRVTTKKIGSLFDWGADLFCNNDELHLFGPMQENVPIPPWVHYHGPTNPDALAKEWYPQAAGMISLSTHDEGRPQVLLEAMAAGLPVLVSSIPAHLDLITDGENGRLIGSADALHTALSDLKNPQSNLALGEQGRAWIRDNIGTWEDCAERYTNLYQELCERSHKNA
jgi:glycosyltransferase involved in cell wall biosynthesis